jgi:phage replication-related protein YjqB (UPF0714/DUF867 family)
MAANRDIYRDFAHLAEEKREGIDYRIVANRRDPRVAVIAPHGGGIEQGTSEIASAIAGREFSLYCFEGLKEGGDDMLHITSTHFDEPNCLRIIAPAKMVLAVHGCEDCSETVFVGGQDLVLVGRLMQALWDVGFQPREDGNPAIAGCHSANICNRGASGRGCQIEISRKMRLDLFEGLDRRNRNTTNPRFEAFVHAARVALLQAKEWPG